MGSVLPGGCASELKGHWYDFSKRFLLETDNSDSSSYFSKEVIFKSTWEVPPPPLRWEGSEKGVVGTSTF